jgi:hypothetical protein
MGKPFRKHCFRMHGLLRNFSAEFREIPAPSHALKPARVFSRLRSSFTVVMSPHTDRKGTKYPKECPAAQKCF